MRTKLNQMAPLIAGLILVFTLGGNAQPSSSGGETGNLIGKAKLTNHQAGKTIHKAALQVNAKGGIQDVVVTIEGIKGTLKKDPIEIDQKDMTYVPRIAVTMAGNEVVFLNNDALLHNVHTYQLMGKIRRTYFNMAQPAKKKVTKTLSKPGLIDVKCDVHADMQAYIVVTKSPFYAKTNEAGLYAIEGIPVGTYKIKAWHEVLGTFEKEVTITAEKKAAVIFEFSSDKTEQ